MFTGGCIVEEELPDSIRYYMLYIRVRYSDTFPVRIHLKVTATPKV